MRRKGFTILELVIAIVVLCALIGTAFISYMGFIERGKSGEAYVNMDAIRKGEEAHKLSTGSYINADDADDINGKLLVGITPRYYEYKVIGASEDNFLILVKRIGEDLSNYIASGTVPAEFMLMAMDRSGAVANAQLFATTGGQAVGGGTGGGDNSWGNTGGITSWVGFSGGGGIGGGSGGGGGVGSLSIATYTEGGSGFTIPPSDPIPTVYNATLGEIREILGNITTLFTFDSAGTPYNNGEYFNNLIELNNITLAYGDTGTDALAYFDPNTDPTVIMISSSLQTEPGWPPEAISSILLHELIHADIFYNTVPWTNTFLSYGWKDSDGTDITAADIIDSTGHIRESVHQEFFTNVGEGEDWTTVSGKAIYDGVVPDQYTVYTVEGNILLTTTTMTGVGFENGKQARLEQGEEAILSYLRIAYPPPRYTEF